MADLAAWLTQIWDEEEASERSRFTMRKDAPPLEWNYGSGDGHVYVQVDGSAFEERMPISEFNRRYTDPAPDQQVLARIAAQRKVLTAYQYRAQRADEHSVTAAHATGLLIALRCLAEGYADRAGYMEDWRP